MKISKWLEWKKYYECETEKARLEMISIIQERDRLFSEIRDQRNWLNSIKKEINELENIYNQKNIDYIAIEHNLNNDKSALERNVSKYIETIEKLSKNAKEWEIELKKIQENIKKEKRNLETIKNKQEKIKYLNQEINKLEYEKEQLSKKINKSEKIIKNKYDKIEQEKIQIREEKNNLKEREANLLLREKRVQKLKESLISKKQANVENE